MFEKRKFNMSFLFICIIVLGTGFLCGYVSSLFVLNHHIAAQPPPADSSAIQMNQEDKPPILPSPTSNQPFIVDQPTSTTADPAHTPTPTQNSSGQASTIKKYIIKTYQGKIGVYQITATGETSLASLLDVDVSNLPQNDQKRLSEGIEVSSDMELLQLLEDYMR